MEFGDTPFHVSAETLDEFINAVVGQIDPSLNTGRHPVYADDFVAWCTNVAKVDLEAYQEDIGLSVSDNRLTAVPSCHGAGKSYLAALIIVWWLTTRSNAFVVWTAPRWKQVRAVVGRYVRRLLKDLDTGMTLLETMELKDRDGELVGMGVSPADNDENGINGIHADNVLIVVDEADGVKESVWQALRSFMSSEAPGTMSRLLAIGNPIVPGSYFHGVVTDPRKGYVVQRIDGLRLPTMSRSAVERYPELAALFEAEGIPYASEAAAARSAAKGISTPTLFAEWLVEWGTDNPYWYSKVRGLHPPVSERQMFTQDMLDAAYALWEEMKPAHDAARCYGFDIAEEGGDETVGYLYHGGKLDLVYHGRGGQTPGVDALKAIKANVQPFERIAVDANGVGRGVYEQLVDANYDVIEHKGSFKARRPDVYTNRKSELYYGLQADLQNGTLGIDPSDAILSGQLLSVRWVYGPKRTVETRREREARIKDSPDRADAVTIARAYAVQGNTKPVSASPPTHATTIGGSEWNDAVMNKPF